MPLPNDIFTAATTTVSNFPGSNNRNEKPSTNQSVNRELSDSFIPIDSGNGVDIQTNLKRLQAIKNKGLTQDHYVEIVEIIKNNLSILECQFSDEESVGFWIAIKLFPAINAQYSNDIDQNSFELVANAVAKYCRDNDFKKQLNNADNNDITPIARAINQNDDKLCLLLLKHAEETKTIITNYNVIGQQNNYLHKLITKVNNDELIFDIKQNLLLEINDPFNMLSIALQRQQLRLTNKVSAEISPSILSRDTIKRIHNLHFAIISNYIKLENSEDMRQIQEILSYKYDEKSEYQYDSSVITSYNDNEMMKIAIKEGKEEIIHLIFTYDPFVYQSFFDIAIKYGQSKILAILIKQAESQSINIDRTALLNKIENLKHTDEVKNQMKAIFDNNPTLASSYNPMENDIAYVKDLFDNKQKEVNDLHVKMEGLQVTAQTTENQNHNLQVENDCLSAEVKSLQDRIQHMMKQFASQQQESIEEKHKLESINKQQEEEFIKQLHAQNQAREEYVSDSKVKMNELCRYNESLSAQVLQSTKETSEARQSQEFQNLNIKELQKQLSVKEVELQKLQNTLDNLKNNHEQIDEKSLEIINQLNNEVSKLRTVFEAKNSELVQQKIILEKAEKDLEEKEIQLLDQNKAVEELQDKLNNFQAEKDKDIKEATRNIEELNIRITELESLLKAEKHESAQQEDGYTAKIAKLEQQLQEHIERANTKDQEYQSSLAQIAQRDQQIADLTKEIQTLSVNTDTQAETLAKKDEEIKNLQNKNEAIEREKLEALEREKKLSEERARLEEEKVALERELEKKTVVTPQPIQVDSPNKKAINTALITTLVIGVNIAVLAALSNIPLIGGFLSRILKIDAGKIAEFANKAIIPAAATAIGVSAIGLATNNIESQRNTQATQAL